MARNSLNWPIRMAVALAAALVPLACLQAVHAQSIMRTLTAITAVFLPLNLITGFFGMNFDSLPLIHTATGVWVAMGVAGAVGAA